MKRITLAVDCDDDDAQTLAKRIPAYLTSLGGFNVMVIEIIELRLDASRK